MKIVEGYLENVEDRVKVVEGSPNKVEGLTKVVEALSEKDSTKEKSHFSKFRIAK